MKEMTFLTTYLHNIWEVVAALAPWLLLGVVIAGILHVFLPADFIVRHLGKTSFTNVFKAALLGVPMPLCSCGVIPTAIGLKRDGASDGASIGFLISTPQTGVDSVAVSAAFLGWPFAFFKLGAAFVTGLVGGLIVNLSEGVRPSMEAQIHTSCVPRTARSFKRSIAEVFNFGFNDLFYGIWRWVALGVLISAAISTFIPADALSGKVWATGFTGMVVMLAISLPLYICTTGSVPIASSLVAAGMSPGAALVFLMAGPATNVATLGAVFKAFGKKILVIYLAVIIIGSMTLGYAFDFVVPSGGATGMTGMHTCCPGFLATAAGILLLLMLGWYGIIDWRMLLDRRRHAPANSGEALHMTVTGMTCQNCANSLARALSSVPGVESVDVELSSGKVKIGGKGLDIESVAAAVRAAGFEPHV